MQTGHAIKILLVDDPAVEFFLIEPVQVQCHCVFAAVIGSPVQWGCLFVVVFEVVDAVNS
jgi:hypothetical protein